MVRRGWLNRANTGIRARDVVILVTLFLVLAGVGSGFGGPARANASSDFVTRSGRGLVLDGQPYTFTGFNIYNANSSGSCGGDYVDGPGLDDALTSMGAGPGVIRAWFFQDMVTVDGQRDWSAFDHTLAVAQAHGKRVIATLANQWQDCEPADGYKDQTWYATRFQDTDPGGTTSYYQYVQDVATRYANDPTVLAWQLMNEAEDSPCATFAGDGVTCLQAAACPPGETPATILDAWADTVSRAIKAVDPNHLISIGTIGSGQCGAQGDQYETLYALPAVDLCEFHDDGNAVDAFPGDQYNGLPVRVAQCAALNKPLFIGELGMPRNLSGQAGDPAQLDTRAASAAAKLDAEFTHGMVGAVVWDWSNAPGDPASWDVGPGDPMLPAVQRWGGGAAAGAGFDLLAAGGDFGGDLPGQVIPAHVVGSPAVVSVAAGDGYTLALDADGSVWSWGSGPAGQLGLGATTDTTTPTRVTGLPPIVRIAARQSVSLALATDGTVWAWGDDSRGQLG
ncbi:MAG TPA: cellulase family glycosylhydrolase, partial [Candidatus Sulfotelmatobacter sp.]|nr:cellulase family glycosylhydrolase [Candidatus Sulfotelmatobacter sp.]